MTRDTFVPHATTRGGTDPNSTTVTHLEQFERVICIPTSRSEMAGSQTPADVQASRVLQRALTASNQNAMS
jgi:hypothetical protein